MAALCAAVSLAHANQLPFLRFQSTLGCDPYFTNIAVASVRLFLLEISMIKSAHG